jgi:hypothetical protein
MQPFSRSDLLLESSLARHRYSGALVNAVQKKKPSNTQGFSKLHIMTENALNWLQQIKNL